MGSLEPFRPEDSHVRAETLYGIVKPHLKDGLSYLDIGCAYAILAPHVKFDFPHSSYFGFDADASTIKYCREHYPWATWEHGAIIPAIHYTKLWLFLNSQQILYQDDHGEETQGDAELPKHKYNVIMHLANDSWQFNDLWKLHLWLIRRGLEEPTLVLLESGWRTDYDGPVITMREIRRLYIAAGLCVLDEGEFQFDCVNYNKNKRVYSLLGRK